MDRPIAGVHTADAEEQLHPTATAGEVFSDGSFLELVRDPSRDLRPTLLRWDGKSATVASEMIVGERRYVPVENDPSLCRHLRLPSGIAPYGSTTQLFDRIRGLIAKYSGLSDRDSDLLTYFVFSTFFVECLETAPCVILHGCASAEAIALLRLLGCICRHPVLLTDAGVSIPRCLRPTRLICQRYTNLEKLLAPLQLSGFGTSQYGSVHEISSATVIYVEDRELRSPCSDSCLRISIAPSGVLFSGIDAQREAAGFVELQNQLLRYRLVHLAKVKGSDFDVPGFSGSIRGLARTLGACIVDAPDLLTCLVMQLQEHDQAVRLDQISQIHPILIEALLVCCHERRADVHIIDLAELVNGILSRHGESLELTARAVGGKLKTLGFRTVRLDSAGRGLYVLGENCKRIHELGKLYGVPSLQKSLPGCPHCQEVGAR
jgi:hypothetical protein